MTKLQTLKTELKELAYSMPGSHEELRIRNQQMFQVSKEIEMLENPEEYQNNKNHWEGGES